MLAALLLAASVGLSACESGPERTGDEQSTEQPADEQSDDEGDDGSDETTDVGNHAEQEKTMELTSSAFDDGGAIPEKYTCNGAGDSPPLEWTSGPEETKSFVVLLEDPDAPGGTFKHWAAFDISADTTSLEAGAAADPSFEQSTNDFEKSGYGPPCPPPSHDAHRYNFFVWALDTDTLDLDGTPHYDDVKSAASEHKLAGAKLTGEFSR